MYFSYQQIAQSVKRLEWLNPFFGTVFLALKEVELPVGITKTVAFVQLLETFLQKYYRPLNDFNGFYIPFNATGQKNWKTRHYANTLHSNTIATFADTLVHPKGSREWGWQSDYVETLWRKHLLSGTIPTFDLAVWLFRSKKWDARVKVSDVLAYFFSEFHIEEAERVLFNTQVPFNANPWLREQAVDTDALLTIIGPPSTRKEVSESSGQLSLLRFFNAPAEEGANLQLLKLTDVGPSAEIEFSPAPRLNVITGDNALGKTFLLECAWWALTGTWASKYPAYPRFDAEKDKPTITFQIGKEFQSERTQEIRYNWKAQSWFEPKNRNVLPGLSLFSQADGSFAIWDPARHILSHEFTRSDGENDAFIYISPSQVWDGLRQDSGGQPVLPSRVICRGLLEDWISWQNASDQTTFNAFSEALKELSSRFKEPLTPGKPTRLLEDVRDIPTLKFSYGEVPIVLCSSGIKRIVALAYMLLWAWNEHVITSRRIREEPQRSIVLLIDEMEAHLHPFWQRTIVPALLNVVQALAREVETQVIVATHSPLVLASIEPRFDQNRDALFLLDLDENGEVQMEEIPFVKHGSVDLWLTSDVFGLTQPRSKEAEEAIESAQELQLQKEASHKKVKDITARLINVLAADDEFWPRWKYFAEQRGVRFDTGEDAT